MFKIPIFLQYPRIQIILKVRLTAQRNKRKENRKLSRLTPIRESPKNERRVVIKGRVDECKWRA